jgi:hypothetical protein
LARPGQLAMSMGTASSMPAIIPNGVTPAAVHFPAREVAALEESAAALLSPNPRALSC